jgi:hypothetical protein
MFRNNKKNNNNNNNKNMDNIQSLINYIISYYNHNMKKYYYYNEITSIENIVNEFDGLTNLILYNNNNILCRFNYNDIQKFSNMFETVKLIKTLQYKLKISPISDILCNLRDLDNLHLDLITYFNNLIPNNDINFLKHVNLVNKYRNTSNSILLGDQVNDKYVTIYFINDDKTIKKYDYDDIQLLRIHIKINNLLKLLFNLNNVNNNHDSLNYNHNNKYQYTDFICPISHNIINDPIMTINNTFYDKSSLKEYILKGYDSDPITRLPLEFKSIPESYSESLKLYNTENNI